MNVEPLLVYLNDLVATSPETMLALVNTRVPAPQAFIDHPHVTVNEEDKVGLLGILNGYLTSQGERPIALVMQEDGQPWGFQQVPGELAAPKPGLLRLDQKQALLSEVRDAFGDIIEQNDLHSGNTMVRVYYDVVEAARHRHQWFVLINKGPGSIYSYCFDIEQTHAELSLTPEQVVTTTLELETLFEEMLEEANPSLLTASDAEVPE